MADTRSYDYVIVGAGSAGCVLAYRLSADGARVCVLEAGGPDRHPLLRVPIGLGKLHEHRMFDWGYDTEPVAAMDGRVIEAMRGKVVGGSSSINVMAYVRGNRGDYDRWAQKGCLGWSYADTLPYFRRCESFEGGADDYRGGDGPLTVEWATFEDPLIDAIAAAAKSAGHPWSEDYNGAEQLGIARGQSTIRKGRRCSAAVAFLNPALARPNVTLETSALATRVMLDGTRAVGIEYLKNGAKHEVRAEREVILSGGVFNSPHLLMLSGIGPADHLREHGIAPVVDSPGVGANLQDHIVTITSWARNGTGPFHALMRADRMAPAFLQAWMFGTGPATILPGRIYGFFKTEPQHAVPDIQFFIRAAPHSNKMWFPGVNPAPPNSFDLRPVLLHPESRGRLWLRSADPRDHVRIVQEFLATDYDVRTIRDGVKLARDIVGRREMDAFRGAELLPGVDARTDKEIDAYVRRTTITAHHPSCSCQMGLGPDAPLDPELRVKGIERLRVVDAAAMPDLVSGNINACVLMIAEKAADMIRGLPPMTPSMAA